MHTELLLKIKGMTCSGCSLSIKRNLERIEFLSNVEIDQPSSSGKMNLSDDEQDKIRFVISQIERMGYEAEIVK